MLPRVYPQMLDVAYEHQDAGRPVYIVTAASQEMAELMAHVLAFDGGIGARSEIVDGVYTGRPDGPFTYREGKAEAIRELAAAEGIDLAESYAYSDSESDLPMLRAVGHPVAVNPDATLLRVAREQGWDVIRLERLGRRLKVAASFVAMGALGASAGRARCGSSVRLARRWGEPYTLARLAPHVGRGDGQPRRDPGLQGLRGPGDGRAPGGRRRVPRPRAGPGGVGHRSGPRRIPTSRCSTGASASTSASRVGDGLVAYVGRSEGRERAARGRDERHRRHPAVVPRGSSRLPRRRDPPQPDVPLRDLAPHRPLTRERVRPP